MFGHYTITASVTKLKENTPIAVVCRGTLIFFSYTKRFFSVVLFSPLAHFPSARAHRHQSAHLCVDTHTPGTPGSLPQPRRRGSFVSLFPAFQAALTSSFARPLLDSAQWRHVLNGGPSCHFGLLIPTSFGTVPEASASCCVRTSIKSLALRFSSARKIDGRPSSVYFSVRLELTCTFLFYLRMRDRWGCSIQRTAKSPHEKRNHRDPCCIHSCE